METSEWVALIASFFTAISGISAAIACILTFRTTRPQIKLRLTEKQTHRVYTHYKDKSFAMLCFDLQNSSTVTGMLGSLCLIYKGEKYYAENFATNYDPSPLEVKSFFDANIEQDATALHLTMPIKVPSFSIVSGFILFPAFPALQVDSISVDIQYRLTNQKFNRKIRRVKFALVFPTPQGKDKQQENHCNNVCPFSDS